jgi:hypothetical protein
MNKSNVKCHYKAESYQLLQNQSISIAAVTGSRIDMNCIVLLGIMLSGALRACIYLFKEAEKSPP